MPSDSVSGSKSSREDVPIPSTSAPAPTAQAEAVSAVTAPELQSNSGVPKLRIERESVDSNSDRRPVSSSFKQQRLKSWQPTVVSGVASPMLFLIAILCLPIGIAVWHFSNEIHEKIIPYHDCTNWNSRNKPCWESMGSKGPEIGKTCECRVNFNLTSDLSGKVFMYYALTNFYQNHRRYVRSRDDSQLFGGTGEPSKQCDPFARPNVNDKSVYWPCGANARSMFQDEITLFTSANITVPLKRTGVAWSSDKEYKFRNPDGWNNPEFKKDHVKPDTWIKSPWELDTTNPKNNGLENEDLIVWMRTAAFPNFRKLYRIVPNGLPKGEYYLKIIYTFPVKNFDGTKSIILSTMSVLGGKNCFLGILFVIIGTFSLCVGFFFFGVRLMERRSPNLARVGVTVPDDYESPFRCPSVQI